MYKIYKITKVEDPMTVYIGQTTLSLSRRLSNHKYQCKLFPNRLFYKWFDSNCIIELLEICNKDPNLNEAIIIRRYLDEGYNVMNTNLGESSMDKANYIKKKNNSNHPEYIKWASGICKKAKKENLSSKEYREKYNIPNYTGPKNK